jgi:hypothetical protein
VSPTYVGVFWFNWGAAFFCVWKCFRLYTVLCGLGRFGLVECGGSFWPASMRAGCVGDTICLVGLFFCLYLYGMHVRQSCHGINWVFRIWFVLVGLESWGECPFAVLVFLYGICRGVHGWGVVLGWIACVCVDAEFMVLVYSLLDHRLFWSDIVMVVI